MESINKPDEAVYTLVEELFQSDKPNRNAIIRAMINLCLEFGIQLDELNDGLTYDLGDVLEDADTIINEAVNKAYVNDPLMYVDY